MLKTVLYILLTLFPLYSYSNVTADELTEKLNKKVSLDIINIPLEKALQHISRHTNLEIIPLNSLTIDNRLTSTRIFLQVKDMPVKQLLDWLAKTINTHYRVFNDGRVYLSDCYEWIANNQFGMLFLDVSNLAKNHNELENFDNILTEVTRIVSLFDNNYYARIEEQGNIIKLVAHTPKDLKPFFHNLIIECTQKGKNIFYKNIFTQPELEEFKKKIKTIKNIQYPYLSLPEIIRKLENDFNINIGFNSLLFNNNTNPPKLSLKPGKVSFKEAIETLINKTSFNGIEISLPDGVWLTKRKAKWEIMNSASFLWINNITINSYHIPKLNLKINGERIAEEIKLQICPQTWFDPLASVIYHKKSGNLLVIADKKTQDKVLTALQELAKRLKVNK